jgi:2,3-bisphosphoglycerate-dependent phosphoglycerate mutase
VTAATARVPETSTLVLLRHGQSTTNAANVFTGWTDVPLTDTGRTESVRAARLLVEAGLCPDEVHTSLLRRAIDTADLVAEQLGRSWLPVVRSWRLNERHYGALTGRDKARVRAEAGPALFDAWRRSWSTSPPPADRTAWLALRADARYAALPDELLPATESLADVADRLLPYWTDVLTPALRAGRVPLVVSHGNTLRALIAVLDRLEPALVERVDVPTGVPLRYDLDHRLRPVVPGGELLDPEAAERVASLVAAEGSP